MSLISRLIAFVFILFLSSISIFIFPQPTLAESSNLGVTENHLAPCPSSPNCVVSQNGDEKHAIEPIPYRVDRDKAKETLLKVLTVVPRTEVVEETDNYIHALSKSRIFKFIDDVEFYFPKDENVIHIRSASRVGESDLGVNRTRMQQIRLAMQDLQV
ncbi:MAG: DUF1499 domain-containing protein [Cyanobacteria bacterium J06636_27]